MWVPGAECPPPSPLHLRLILNCSTAEVGGRDVPAAALLTLYKIAKQQPEPLEECGQSWCSSCCQRCKGVRAPAKHPKNAQTPLPVLRSDRQRAEIKDGPGRAQASGAGAENLQYERPKGGRGDARQGLKDDKFHHLHTKAGKV